MKADWTPNALTYDAHLLRLAQRFGPGEHVVASNVRVVSQYPRSHARNVPLVDRCRLSRSVGPSHDIATPNLSRPPVHRIRREHARPDERRRDAGRRNQLLDVRVHDRHGVWLLEKGMWRPMWR